MVKITCNNYENSTEKKLGKKNPKKQQHRTGFFLKTLLLVSQNNKHSAAMSVKMLPG